MARKRDYLLSSLLMSLLLCTGLHAEDLLEKGISDYKAENYEEAEVIFSGVLKTGPDSTTALYYMGLTQKRLGNLKAAIPYLKKAAQSAIPVRDSFLELADTYIALENYKEAYHWLDLADKNGAAASNTAFLRGQILMNEKRFDDAIVQFGKAKSADPALAPSADLQIAMAHASERRLEKARASLKTVITISPESEMAEYARSYEKTFDNVIKEHRTWRGTLYTGYLYDDNVFGKPRSELFGINFPKKSDNGFVGNFRLDYTPFLEGRKLFSAQYAVNTTTYGQRSEYNQIVQNFSLTPGISLSNGAVTLPVIYSHYMLGQDPYMHQIAVRPSYFLMFKEGHIAQFSLGFARREMLKKPLSPQENRDSNIFSGTVGYLYTFAEGKGFFNVRYELSDDVAEGTNWHNLGNRFSAVMLIPLWSRLSATASGEVQLQNYQNANSYFGVRRDDTLWNGVVGLSYEIRKGFKLNAQYAHTRAESNINIYDYTRNTVMCGLETVF